MRRLLVIALALATACTSAPAASPSPPPAGTAARSPALRVLVTEPDGPPVAGAHVCASTTRSEERCADATRDGRVELGLPRGLWFVRIGGPAGGARYEDAQRVADLSAGDVALWVEIAPLHRVSGRVRDAGGRAVDGAEVCAHPVDEEAATCERSRPDGTYTIAARAGLYRVAVSGPAGGRLVPEWAVDRGSADDADVYDLRTADVTGVDVVLVHGVVLRGRVTVAGRPVEAAQVCIKTLAAPVGWECERTDKDGRYSALRVPGDYWVWIVPPDDVLVPPQWYPSGFAGVGAQPFDLSTDATLDYDLRTQPVRILSGIVRTPWGSPAAGLLVCADTAFTTGRICRETAATGRYAIALRPETYIVSVIAPADSGFISEYWSRKRDWTEADEVSLLGGDRTLDLVARTGSTLSGVVRTKSGAPVASATLNFSDGTGVAAAVATDLAGRFSAVLLPGRFHVEVFPPFVGDHLGRELDVEVPSLDDLDIVLDDVSVP